MIKIVLLLLITVQNALALDAFKADYVAYKGGKQIGTSVIELSKDHDLYTIIDSTVGTHGMASFLGFKRTETTVFSKNNSFYSPVSYEMKQKVAFKKRNSSYQVDNEAHMIYGSHKGKEWRKKIPDNFYTPNLVTLKVFEDICAGVTENLSYTILKRGQLSEYKFNIIETNDSIIEIEKIHSNPNTITKTWLDTKQQCLPVKIYHKEKGEDALETKLTQLSFH